MVTNKLQLWRVSTCINQTNCWWPNFGIHHPKSSKSTYPHPPAFTRSGPKRQVFFPRGDMWTPRTWSFSVGSDHKASRTMRSWRVVLDPRLEVYPLNNPKKPWKITMFHGEIWVNQQFSMVIYIYIYVCLPEGTIFSKKKHETVDQTNGVHGNPHVIIHDVCSTWFARLLVGLKYIPMRIVLILTC